jgi:hypothetical protein
VSNVRATLTISLFVFAGCHARQTGPDANYEKGSRIYQQLYAQQLDDAYGDPKMDEAVGLLEQVDPRSVDAPSAKRMLASIDSGRVLLAKQRAERAKMAAAAAAAIASQPQLDATKIIAASTPDAGPVDPFGPGATVADINAATGGCLIEGEPYREQQTNATGTVYRLAKSEQCAERLPGFVGQVVLVADGHIYRRTADPTLTKAPVPSPPPQAPDAGPVPAEAGPAAVDAGRPTAAAKAPLAPPAPDADAGEPQMYIPGMPRPEGMAPPPPPDQQDQ